MSGGFDSGVSKFSFSSVQFSSVSITDGMGFLSVSVFVSLSSCLFLSLSLSLSLVRVRVGDDDGGEEGWKSFGIVVGGVFFWDGYPLSGREGE